MTIKLRDFEVRLTRNKEERKQVRQLRYNVFVEEEGASATEEQRALREEYDSYDRFAEYMAVFHNGRVVGTYRIIDRKAAEKMDGFYTESEYNISKIKKIFWGFPGGSVVKNLPASGGDTGSIPHLGRFHMLQSDQVQASQLLGLCPRAREPKLMKPTRPTVHALQ